MKIYILYEQLKDLLFNAYKRGRTGVDEGEVNTVPKGNTNDIDKHLLRP